MFKGVWVGRHAPIQTPKTEHFWERLLKNRVDAIALEMEEKERMRRMKGRTGGRVDLGDEGLDGD
jgi:hypothetical protein